MKHWKRLMSLCLALALALSLAACGGQEAEETPDQEETPAEEPATLRVAALKGPTAMGMVELMKYSEGEAET